MKYLVGYLTLGAFAAIGYVAGAAFTIYKYEASDYFAEDEELSEAVEQLRKSAVALRAAHETMWADES